MPESQDLFWKKSLIVREYVDYMDRRLKFTAYLGCHAKRRWRWENGVTAMALDL
jgi:hypothetical protein